MEVHTPARHASASGLSAPTAMVDTPQSLGNPISSPSPGPTDHESDGGSSSSQGCDDSLLAGYDSVFDEDGLDWASEAGIGAVFPTATARVTRSHTALASAAAAQAAANHTASVNTDSAPPAHSISGPGPAASTRVRSRSGPVAGSYRRGSDSAAQRIRAVRCDGLESYINTFGEGSSALPCTTPAQQTDGSHLNTAVDLSATGRRQFADCDGIGMLIAARAVSVFEYYWFTSSAAWGTKASTDRQDRGELTACIATKPVHLYIRPSAVPAVRLFINEQANRFHISSFSENALTAQPLQIAASLLVGALAHANVQQVYFQHLGSKQDITSAVALINRLQSFDSDIGPVSLDIARTFSTRLGTGTAIEALQLDITVDSVRAGEVGYEDDSDGDAADLPSSAALESPAIVRSAGISSLGFTPEIPRTVGSFANGTARFAIHPYLGVLGNLRAGGFRITLKVGALVLCSLPLYAHACVCCAGCQS